MIQPHLYATTGFIKRNDVSSIEKLTLLNSKGHGALSNSFFQEQRPFTEPTLREILQSLLSFRMTKRRVTTSQSFSTTPSFVNGH